MELWVSFKLIKYFEHILVGNEIFVVHINLKGSGIFDSL